MKAYVDGAHFFIYLDTEKNEIERLREEKFKAPLQLEDGRNAGKKLILEHIGYMGRSQVLHFPEDSNWEDLEIINVSLGRDDYRNLQRTRSAILRDGPQSYQIQETNTSGMV